MRIRTILAAAAAPAALAAVLLGTAGQASASVAAPAVLTASVQQQAAKTVTANTHRQGVADTTNVAGNATRDSGQGPQWATDNLEQKITAVQDAPGSQLWHVTVDTTGSFAAFANPLDGNAWTGGSGSIKGTIEYNVTSPNTPAASNINGNLPAGTGFTAMLTQFFGGSMAYAADAGGHYSFTYNPVPVPSDMAFASGTGGISYGQGPSGLDYQQVG